MKIFLFLIIFLSPVWVFANTFTKTVIRDISLQYITYNIGSQEYTIKVGISDSAIPLEDLAIQNNAITAINGVFFCPADYPQCNGKNYTINERFIDGKDFSFYPDTGERWVFWWNKKGLPFLFQTWKINKNKRKEIYEGLWNFPILYADGINMLERYHDIWLYDSKMKASLNRHFICSNKEKTKIIFGRTWATSLDNLAPALYKLWCWDALNLDAGNSSQYIYNGDKLVSGKRNILDGFMIERVWLDIQNLESKLDYIFNQVSKQYKKYPYKTKLLYLNKFLDIIPKIRTELYEKYSQDILDNTWEIIGYKIEITSLSDLKRIYIINSLERRIKMLLKNL